MHSHPGEMASQLAQILTDCHGLNEQFNTEFATSSVVCNYPDVSSAIAESKQEL